METSLPEFFQYLQPVLHAFITHNFVAKWQDVNCRKSMVDMHATSYCRMLTSQRITRFRFRMRSRACTGKTLRSPSLCMSRTDMTLL